MPKRGSCGSVLPGCRLSKQYPSINSPAVRCCTSRARRDAHRTLLNSPVSDIARRLVPASRLPSRAAPALNPHSARCLAGAQLPATSCLGAFRPPATSSGGGSRDPGVRKPCMGPIGVKERVAVLSSHFVTSPDCICGMDSLLLGCAERSSPKAACGAPKARGLTANAQSEPS
jgi:hypothetical protein